MDKLESCEKHLAIAERRIVELEVGLPALLRVAEAARKVMDRLYRQGQTISIAEDVELEAALREVEDGNG